MNHETSRSLVKFIDIKSPKSTVFSFLADPMNWPKWAVVNLTEVKNGSDGWFKMVTRRGTGDLKIHPQENLGILDHTWKDSQATWTVPMRVVPNGEGTTVMITFFQPSVMNDEQFDFAMKEMDIELAELKKVLENHEHR